MGAPDLKLPWEPIDPHGDGILARIVHDAESGHVGVFDTAEQARAVCETMNRAPGVEAERNELAAEVASARTRLAGMRAALETSEGRPLTDRTAREKAEAKLARSLELWREWTSTDITEDDDRWVEFTNRAHALLEEP